MKAEQERVRHLVTETVTALCRNGLKNHKTLSVHGLIGVTVDDSEVFLIRIDDPYSNPSIGENLIRSHTETLHSSTVRNASRAIAAPEIDVSSAQHQSSAYLSLAQLQASSPVIHSEPQQVRCNEEKPIVIESIWTEDHSSTDHLIEFVSVNYSSESNQLTARSLPRESSVATSSKPRELSGRSSSASCVLVSSDDSQFSARSLTDSSQLKQEPAASDDDTIALSASRSTSPRQSQRQAAASARRAGGQRRKRARKQRDYVYPSPASAANVTQSQSRAVRSSPLRAVTTGVKGRSLAERRVFPCPHCSKRFTFVSNLRTHQRRQHSSAVSKAVSGAAPVDSASPAAGASAKHLSIAERRVVACPDCDMRFTVSGYLIRHQRQKHCHRLLPPPPPPPALTSSAPPPPAPSSSTPPQQQASLAGDTGQFACVTCGKVFTQHRLLLCHKQAHLRTSASTRPGHTFASGYRQLTPWHRVEQGKKRRCVCTVCNKTFGQLAQLKVHTRLHTGERPFKCTSCDKAFRSDTMLKTHVRSHTGERPYVCTVCGRAFSTSSILCTHTRLHTGEKPYVCTVCGKAFTQQHHLSTHVRVHTGERPFACGQCGSTFLQQANLNRHVANSHKSV